MDVFYLEMESPKSFTTDPSPLIREVVSIDFAQSVETLVKLLEVDTYRRQCEIFVNFVTSRPVTITMQCKGQNLLTDWSSSFVTTVVPGVL